MRTPSRLPWDDMRRPRTCDPPGLTATLGAQLLACGVVGWTMFAVGVERFMPHVSAAAPVSRTVATHGDTAAQLPIAAGRSSQEIERVSNDRTPSVVSEPHPAIPADPCQAASQLQVAAAGPTVPHSQH